MKNKSKEYKILLLYDILATSDCLCSASSAYNTILQLGPIKLQQPADRLLQKPVKSHLVGRQKKYFTYFLELVSGAV